jgi:hypothetical protein
VCSGCRTGSKIWYVWKTKGCVLVVEGRRRQKWSLILYVSLSFFRQVQTNGCQSQRRTGRNHVEFESIHVGHNGWIDF